MKMIPAVMKMERMMRFDKATPEHRKDLLQRPRDSTRFQSRLTTILKHGKKKRNNLFTTRCRRSSVVEQVIRNSKKVGEWDTL